LQKGTTANTLSLCAWHLVGAAALSALPAIAHDTGHEARAREYFQPGAAFSGLPGDDAAAVPFHQGLSAASFPASTLSAEAQAYVDQGMALVWGFTHAEAVRSFRAAQALDPSCAMCFWGEALALGPNINDTMAQGAIRPAWAAIKRANDLSATESLREKALIEALSAPWHQRDGRPQQSRSSLSRCEPEWRKPIDLNRTIGFSEYLVRSRRVELLYLVALACPDPTGPTW
jgi:hypothetical protein